MNKPIPDKHYSGTILFFIIRGIKDMHPNTALRLIVSLNEVVAGSSLVHRLGKGWVGTTISGLFIVIPDDAKLIPHLHVPELFEHSAGKGVPIRCGITWGPVLCFQDVDDKANFVGRAINIAARLAYSSDNLGCLIHEKYEDYARGFSTSIATEILDRADTRLIKGKEHDPGFNCRLVTKEGLSILDSAPAMGLQEFDKTVESTSGLVLAYDLPKFSEGDESQLSKRVRSVVDTLRSLRQNRQVLQKAKLFFCPGGDGGILVVDTGRQEAYGLSRDLAQKLVVESEYKESSIAVEARLGIHYGAVAFYQDVGGRLRPTGPTCFIADEIISDSASREAGLVFSDSLRDVISHGSEQNLRNEFDELPMLKSGPAAGIARFTRKRSARADFKHPLIERLFGPTSSWQPESTD